MLKFGIIIRLFLILMIWAGVTVCDIRHLNAEANSFDSLPSDVQRQINNITCVYASPARVISCRNEETQKYLASKPDNRFDSLPSDVQRRITIQHVFILARQKHILWMRTQKYLASKPDNRFDSLPSGVQRRINNSACLYSSPAKSYPVE